MMLNYVSVSAQGVSVGFHLRSFFFFVVEGRLPLSKMALLNAADAVDDLAAKPNKQCQLCLTYKELELMADGTRCKECNPLRLRIVRMRTTTDEAHLESCAKFDQLNVQDRAAFYKADSEIMILYWTKRLCFLYFL